MVSSECAPAGSPIVRVNAMSPENGPGTTVPAVDFGKLARTRQWKRPVPVIFVAVMSGHAEAGQVLVRPVGQVDRDVVGDGAR